MIMLQGMSYSPDRRTHSHQTAIVTTNIDIEERKTFEYQRKIYWLSKVSQIVTDILYVTCTPWPLIATKCWQHQCIKNEHYT